MELNPLPPTPETVGQQAIAQSTELTKNFYRMGLEFVRFYHTHLNAKRSVTIIRTNLLNMHTELFFFNWQLFPCCFCVLNILIFMKRSCHEIFRLQFFFVKHLLLASIIMRREDLGFFSNFREAVMNSLVPLPPGSQTYIVHSPTVICDSPWCINLRERLPVINKPGSLPRRGQNVFTSKTC